MSDESLASGGEGVADGVVSAETLNDIVGLVALREVQDCLTKVVEAQEKSLGHFTAPDRLRLSRALADIRRKLDILLLEASPEWRDWS